MDDQGIQRQVQIFKALMHPTRLMILEMLRSSEACVCHLEAHLGLPQAYLSQQLAVLRKAELIIDRREGLNIFYRVIQPDVWVLLDTACSMSGRAEPMVRVKLLVDCPCPKCASMV